MLTFMTACSDTNDLTQSASATSSTAPQALPSSALDSSDACRYLASSMVAELVGWAASDAITNAPIAETRLGTQPDGGIPGDLTEGCVWEVRGTDGGHIGVAVERFVNVDIASLAAMATDAGVTPNEVNDGRNRWDIPASDDSPSGAILIGDADELVVVRVESYSDNADRTFVIGTLEGSDRFFSAVGDAVEASPPD